MVFYFIVATFCNDNFFGVLSISIGRDLQGLRVGECVVWKPFVLFVAMAYCMESMTIIETNFGMFDILPIL